MAKDYYDILGVPKTATTDEIKAAFRKLAIKYHPDHFSTASEEEKKAAEEKFKEINHAYDVLTDEQKRAAYDQYGDENGPQMGAGGFGGGYSSGMGGFGFNVDDIFSTIFSGFTGGASGSAQRDDAPRRGSDILVRLTLSFEEAVKGVTRNVEIERMENCPHCHGTGAKNGTAVKVCPKCGGRGSVTIVQRSPFGQIGTTRPCPNCGGKGKIVTEKCSACGGKGRTEVKRKLTVQVPAGIDTGQKITYRGEGHHGVNGGENGNCVFEIRVQEHRLFKRNGSDLYLDLPISFEDAALGATLRIVTPYDVSELKIPEGTQTGTVFKIKDRGMPKIVSGQRVSDQRTDRRGDMFVKVFVEVPKSLSREQKELIKKLASSIEQKQYPKKKEFDARA